MNNKILVLGDGLLGSEIVKQTGWNCISRETDGFDIRFSNFDLFFHINQAKIIINCIGYTNTYDKQFIYSYQNNLWGPINLVTYCNKKNKKLVQISTDYIYAGSIKPAKETDVPVHANNWYSYYKLVADAYVQSECEKYLLIRTSFKPKPFPYEKATTAQIGNFDYVDVIANLIIRLVKKNASGIYNVGTEEKTIYNLAIKTKPNVEKVDYLFDTSMPPDIRMDITKMEEFLNEG